MMEMEAAEFQSEDFRFYPRLVSPLASTFLGPGQVPSISAVFLSPILAFSH